MFCTLRTSNLIAKLEKDDFLQEKIKYPRFENSADSKVPEIKNI